MSKAAADTLEKVSGEFEQEVILDIEGGREETLKKIESVRKETEESVSKILETGAKQSESVKRQIIGAAELEARNLQLKSLEKAVTGAFESAMERISSLTGASYEKAVVKLAQEGLDVIGPKARIQFAAKDKRSVSAATKKLDRAAKVSLDDTPLQTIGGVALTTPDGTVRFDNTFEARLERLRPTLRKEVAAVLTGTS